MSQQSAQWQVANAYSVQQVQQQQYGNSGPWMLIGSQAKTNSVGAPITGIAQMTYAQGSYGLQQPYKNIDLSGPSASLCQPPPLGMYQNGITPAVMNSNPAVPFSQQMPAFQQTLAPGQMKSQQAPQWCSAGYGGNSGKAMTTRVRRLKKPAQSEKGLKLSAVVVTICYESSYDELFQHVPQQGIEGTYVATYEVVGSIEPVLKALRGDRSSLEAQVDIGQLIQDIGKVEPNAVVFNWECCSGCATECFCTKYETKKTLEIIRLLLERGHMVMCSDFSLKALIRQWSVRRLGPNPFVKLGEFGGSMRLDFDRTRVAECPSAQLRNAQELSEDGCCTVNCMPMSLAYTVDKRVAEAAKIAGSYELDVLTVATEIPGIAIASLPAWQACELGDKRGAAGHVCLTYPSGGCLLASAGHWVELMRIEGVSEKNLLKMAEANYGTAYSAKWSAQLAAAPNCVARAQMSQTFAQKLVQQSAPCNYSRS